MTDVLSLESAPGSTWSTTNLSESIPGVPTPLGWSIWYPAGELAVRRTFREIGVLSRREALFPEDPSKRLMGIFHGRAALRVDLICEWVERVPGTDSAAMSEAAFSAVPDGYVSRSQPRYFPRVAARAAVPFVKAPRLIREQAPVVRSLRAQALEQLPAASAVAARAWLEHGVGHWMEGLFRNTLVTMGAVQPAIERLELLGEVAGVPGKELMAGHGGHEETQVVADAWACSRDVLPFEEFVARHGYHGWHEGEVSARVWREDPDPPSRLIEGYRSRPDSEDPVSAERVRVARRRDLEAEFLAALPRARRLQGRLALALAAKYVPLRGAGKVTFLRGLDVTRAAARRLGENLAAEGEIDQPEDVFYLTLPELRGPLPPDSRELIAARRAAREGYETLGVPEVFRGTPDAVEAAPHESDLIEGTGASPGVVIARVRVVRNVDDAHMSEDEPEILVGHTTDPSWASLMFLSSGLIADIGGTLSHTAVVARELGLPCVVNTKVATRALRTGDLVRLDGSAGVIEVLERAPAP